MLEACNLLDTYSWPAHATCMAMMHISIVDCIFKQVGCSNAIPEHQCPDIAIKRVVLEDVYIL